LLEGHALAFGRRGAGVMSVGVGRGVGSRCR
jgi:hypothetical protein